MAGQKGGATMSVVVDIKQRLGDFALDAQFETQGGVTALFGPSGSGKTSVINAIAGLSRPEGGQIKLDDRVLLDAETFVPPHKRRVGYVFQQPRLFPHMTVQQNIDYGRSRPLHTLSSRYFPALQALDLNGLLARSVANLSGGEAQRVALARALLSNPEIILMDEPLAALDAARAGDGLSELTTSAGRLFLPRVPQSDGAPLRVRIKASDVILSKDKPDGLSALNILKCTVSAIHEGAGPGAAVALRSGEDRLVARVTARSVRALGLRAGASCYAVVKTVSVAPADMGGRGG